MTDFTIAFGELKEKLTTQICYNKFDFSEAMRRLNQEKCVMRVAWSQHVPLTFLVLVPETQFEKGVVAESYIGAVSIKGNENIRIAKFDPLQEDLFANDWIEYEYHLNDGTIFKI